jgi:SAM-dependent methyltransferase
MDSADDWDQRYADKEQWWSGQPNATLVAELGADHDGHGRRALDVGCGEGADAIWLAHHGWTVDAIDISQVALDRAHQMADQAGVTVTWKQADIAIDPPPSGAYGLVTVHYPALRLTPGNEAIHALRDAVAPGGTLLVVGHDFEHGHHHKGFDPSDYVQPRDVARLLDDGDRWTVDVLETRPRTPPPGFGGPDVPDVVLRATRRG